MQSRHKGEPINIQVDRALSLPDFCLPPPFGPTLQALYNALGVFAPDVILSAEKARKLSERLGFKWPVELSHVGIEQPQPAHMSLESKKPDEPQTARKRTDNLKRAIFDAWTNGMSATASASEVFDYLVSKDDTG